MNSAEIMLSIDKMKVQEFDTELVASSTYRLPRSVISLWLMRLKRRGYLMKKKGKFPRLCNYAGGKCNRGYKNVYMISKNGRKFLNWTRSPVGLLFGTRIFGMISQEELEKMPEEKLITLLNEAFARTTYRYKRFSRDRKVRDFAIRFIMSKKYRQLLEEKKLVEDHVSLLEAQIMNQENRERILQEIERESKKALEILERRHSTTEDYGDNKYKDIAKRISDAFLSTIDAGVISGDSLVIPLATVTNGISAMRQYVIDV